MVVDLTPLLRGVRGDAFRIAGVAVGDRAGQVDLAGLTGAEDTAPGEARTYTDKTVYRTDPNGALVEIPLTERIAATIERGGWLRAGAISLWVANGCIERIIVRGPSLASLGIRREDAIERQFGPAAGHERSFGQRLHYYPDRAVVVAWHSEEDRLDHIQLGPAEFHEPRLGASELLGELLEVDVKLVSGAVPKGGSARVHYERAEALARALGLGSVAEVVRGQFIDGELGAGRQCVLAELAARGKLRGESVGFRFAREVFLGLLHYRQDVERVVRATSRWKICSDPALLGMIATQNRLADEFKALMVDVDRWLCTLMAPDHQTFALRDLIAHHAWPDVDLYAIEIDEF